MSDTDIAGMLGSSSRGWLRALGRTSMHLSWIVNVNIG
jgi:hypothetical protein